MSETIPSKQSTSKIRLTLDFRIITLILFGVIVILLGLWRPWQADTTGQSRTVSVSGQATIKASPDKYVFMPAYDFKNTDKSAALAELTAKQTAVVAGLKQLGVRNEQLKTDASGNDYGFYYDDETRTNNYTLDVTVTLADTALVQKVQDYLVTTSPTGSVSPTGDFSQAKREQLESQGRDEATKNARAKADQSAKNLGFKIGKVKSISDSSTGGIQPHQLSTNDAAAATNMQSLPVQAGQNELNYSVNVVYFID